MGPSEQHGETIRTFGKNGFHSHSYAQANNQFAVGMGEGEQHGETIRTFGKNGFHSHSYLQTNDNLWAAPTPPVPGFVNHATTSTVAGSAGDDGKESIVDAQESD